MRKDLIIKSRKKFYNAIDNRNFRLTLLPTEKCNFRCSYCYEDHKVGRMSDQTVTAIKTLLENRAKEGDLKRLVISWFGGEPLLEKKIVYDISLHAKKLADSHGFIFRGNVTTNGYFLNEDTVRGLFDSDVLGYQISLDGYKDVHDQTRKTVSNRGTFETIWNNLLEMKKRKERFWVLLRVHVTSANIENVKMKLVPSIEEAFGGDDRFRIFIRSISNLGGAGENFTILSKAKSDDIVADLYASLKRNGKIKPCFYEEEGKGSYICYAAKPNAFVIRADGSIGKCTVAFNDDRNNIGKILENGTMSLDQEKSQFWLQSLKKCDEFGSKCPYRFACAK